jgi:transcriptional regulator with XRE-family HTH domain
MSVLLTPAEIEARAKVVGLSLPELCERAGIALSTFYRWRSGDTSPSIDVYRRLVEAAARPTKVAA